MDSEFLNLGLECLTLLIKLGYKCLNLTKGDIAFVKNFIKGLVDVDEDEEEGDGDGKGEDGEEGEVVVADTG